eukprot:TRINITY_DN10550_c1_g2_i1.p1 TRINITY_DN10550_c1_g2~~TRINITY_DN10550_c1_g2_i1.p1  ORF type:complete len:994 (-),score=152.67 TRINITY_DN10550_c1_g2_i1:15-2996(-)
MACASALAAASGALDGGYIADSGEEDEKVPMPSGAAQTSTAPASASTTASSASSPSAASSSSSSAAGTSNVDMEFQSRTNEGSEDDDVTCIECEFAGYTLRDLRRIVDTMLPRYGHLLSNAERTAIESFSQMPLRAQQLYARLFSRKWPQWVPLQGLGSKYRELGEEEAQAAVRDLSTADSTPWDLTGPTQMSHPTCVAPWLIDTAFETASSLLARPLGNVCDSSSCSDSDPQQAAASLGAENFGTLLLDALPVAQLREFALSIGAGNIVHAEGRRGSKERLLTRLREAARKQRVLSGFLGTPARGCGNATTEAQLVTRALGVGRWVCIAPTPGRNAFAALVELFHLESCGTAESTYVIFSTRWPKYSLQEAPAALFADRGCLDAFLNARRMVLRLESSFEQPSSDRLALDASIAETELRRALSLQRSDTSGFSSWFEVASCRLEAEKLRCPFRRRFTVAWCWADALHHAVMRAPAAGDDQDARSTKIRQLRLLLESRLCVSRRGRWYNELAKEVSRAESALAALHVAAEGLAEGEPPPVAARINVDLTAESASSQDVELTESQMMGELPVLPRDARWELAQRCLTLARGAVAATNRGRGRSCTDAACRRQLRDTPAAQRKACGGDDGGRWLPALVDKLRAEEAAAAGPPRSVNATSCALPADPLPKDGMRGVGGRRMFAGFDLAELTVEELALRHYLSNACSLEFTCGLHCEGALLRDLFGLLMYDQLFDTSVKGVFMSLYQDAPLDLGSEAFYVARAKSIETRLDTLARLPSTCLAAEVRNLFTALYGTRIRGVRWDRYEGPDGVFRNNVGEGECSVCDKESDSKEKTDDSGKDAANSSSSEVVSRRVIHFRTGEVLPQNSRDLGAAAGAIGGQPLAAALRLLCEDYNSAGLPDLLVWSWSEDETSRPRARFIEVKSERDVLSRRQRLWLATLRGAGAEAEVCHVRDEPPDPELAGKKAGVGGSKGRGRKRKADKVKGNLGRVVSCSDVDA